MGTRASPFCQLPHFSAPSPRATSRGRVGGAALIPEAPFLILTNGPFSPPQWGYPSGRPSPGSGSHSWCPPLQPQTAAPFPEPKSHPTACRDGPCPLAPPHLDTPSPTRHPNQPLTSPKPQSTGCKMPPSPLPALYRELPAGSCYSSGLVATGGCTLQELGPCSGGGYGGTPLVLGGFGLYLPPG